MPIAEAVVLPPILGSVSAVGELPVAVGEMLLLPPLDVVVLPPLLTIFGSVSVVGDIGVVGWFGKPVVVVMPLPLTFGSVSAVGDDDVVVLVVVDG